MLFTLLLNISLRSFSSKKDFSGSIPTLFKIGKTTSKILPLGSAIVKLLLLLLLLFILMTLLSNYLCSGFNFVGQGISISSR